MSGSILRRLILKDLYLMRPLMLGALIVGGIGIAVMPLGETAFFLGWLVLFIAVVLLGVFTTAALVIGERKDKVHLFVMTLPTSPAQYTAAKLAASTTAFLVPSAILAVSALTLIAATGIPDALMAFLAALLLYAVCYYAAYLAVALVTDSVIWATLVIIIGNTAPVFIIPALARLPEMSPEVASGPIWSGRVLAILAAEAAFSAAVIGLALYIRSRQRDLV